MAAAAGTPLPDLLPRRRRRRPCAPGPHPTDPGGAPLRTTATEPVGAAVTDLDLREVTDAEVEELRAACSPSTASLVLPGQDVDDEAFVAFLRRFGDLAFTAGETPVEGCPDLNLISNVGRTTPPRSQFHVDSTYLASAPGVHRAAHRDHPRAGRRDAVHQPVPRHDTLPDDLRERLEGRPITHVVTGLDPDQDDETQAQHPVFRPHPLTGRPRSTSPPPPAARRSAG